MRLQTVCERLGNDFLDDTAMDIGEAEIPPAVAEREFLMVQAHQVQDRCM